MADDRNTVTFSGSLDAIGTPEGEQRALEFAHELVNQMDDATMAEAQSPGADPMATMGITLQMSLDFCARLAASLVGATRSADGQIVNEGAESLDLSEPADMERFAHELFSERFAAAWSRQPFGGVGTKQ